MKESAENGTEVIVAEYLLADELRLWDAWRDPGMEDTRYRFGVLSMADMRRRHGKHGAVAAFDRAAKAFDRLSKAGGANPDIQLALLERLALARAAIGPNWRDAPILPAHGDENV